MFKAKGIFGARNNSTDNIGVIVEEYENVKNREYRSPAPNSVMAMGIVRISNDMKITFWLILFSVVSFPSCFVGKVRHEPRSAIRVAEAFARTAFVDKNFEQALTYASKEKITLKAGAFEDAILQIQGSVPFPTGLRATAYEIPFGQNQVIVYLEGAGENRMSYYRVLTVGDASSEYGVMEVFRADAPFPKGSLQEPIR